MLDLMTATSPVSAPGVLIALMALCFSEVALAGRPLAVDDANVNEPGQGHVELWASHTAGSRVYNLAPAFAPIKGLEVSALLARDRTTLATLSAVQAKWRITPSHENGCNLATVLGIGHTSISDNSKYLNGLFTCNRAKFGSMHLNLGISKTRSSGSVVGWGVAFETEVMGVTPHLEWFGEQHTKPTVQVGLRGNISPSVQLDGSVGRVQGANVYTVGTKIQF